MRAIQSSSSSRHQSRPILPVLAALVLLSGASVVCGQPAAQTPDLSTHLKVALLLDGDLEAVGGKPGATVEGTTVYKAGRIGRGIHVGKGTWLRLPMAASVFNQDEGTMMLWFKPDTPFRERPAGSNEGNGVYRRILSMGNLFNVHKDQFDRLVYSIGSKHVITTEPNWKAGEWIHLAVTWKRVQWEMEMLLYVDGQQYRWMTGRGRGVFPDGFKADALNIASFGTRALYLGAVVDEFGLFDKALAHEDVRAIYGHGESLANIHAGRRLDHFPALQNLAYQRWPWGKVPQLNRWFPYKSVADGSVSGRYAKVDPEKAREAGLPVFIEIDLGEVKKVNRIRLWNHTHGRFLDVRVETSTQVDPDVKVYDKYPAGLFKGDHYVVHDNARDGSYEETVDGHLFTFPARDVRFIRCYNSGTTTDQNHPNYGQAHWRELQVFYDALAEKKVETNP